jgi:hypothetical protein
VAKKKSSKRIIVTGTVTPFDPAIPSEAREVVTTKEAWSEYILNDGNTIRIKPIPVMIHRAKDRYSPQGEPMYFVRVAFVVTAAEKRRKKR